VKNRRLTKSEFKATMIDPMTNVSETATDLLDIWPYVSESDPDATCSRMHQC